MPTLGVLQSGYVGMLMELLTPNDCTKMPFDELELHQASIQAAVEELWKAGVAHGDLARRNVSIDSSGMVRLMDLGQAVCTGDYESAREMDSPQLEDLI